VGCSGSALKKVVDMHAITVLLDNTSPFKTHVMLFQTVLDSLHPSSLAFPQFDIYSGKYFQIYDFKFPHQVAVLNQVSSVNMKC